MASSNAPDSQPAQGNQEPRAVFAETSGMVLQIVGMLVSLGGCCFWSLSGLAQAELPDASAEPSHWFRSAELPQIMVALETFASFAAGLGMFATGIGMSAGIRLSAAGGMAATGLFALVWIVGTVVRALSLDTLASALPVLISLALAVVGIALFLLCGAAHRDIREHPRPPDDSAAPPDTDSLYASAREMPSEKD